jgi:Transposase domain (DUF772)
MLYSVRTERLPIEEIDYSMLFRWFVGMNLEEPEWDVYIDRIPDRSTAVGIPDSLRRALRERMSQISRRLPGRAISWMRIVAILP